MDRKLTPSEIAIMAGGGLLFVSSFLAWHSVDIPFAGTFSVNGWEDPSTPWSILAVLVGLALAVTMALKKFAPNVNLPDRVGNFTWAQIYFFGAIAAAAFLVIKLLSESEALAIGFYLAVVGAGAMVYGGWMEFNAAKGGTGNVGGFGAPPPPPPPPA